MKTRTYQILLENKLSQISDTIREISESLRCCGNCANFNRSRECELKKHDGYTSTQPFRCCNEWNSDNLTSKEREIV